MACYLHLLGAYVRASKSMMPINPTMCGVRTPSHIVQTPRRAGHGVTLENTKSCLALRYRKHRRMHTYWLRCLRLFLGKISLPCRQRTCPYPTSGLRELVPMLDPVRVRSYSRLSPAFGMRKPYPGSWCFEVRVTYRNPKATKFSIEKANDSARTCPANVPTDYCSSAGLPN